MYSYLVQPRPEERVRNTRLRRKKYRPVEKRKPQRIDSATLAANLQLLEEQRDLVYSFLSLAMKIGLLGIATLTLIRLGGAFYQRVDRHAELSGLLDVQTSRLISLQSKFDNLFTIGGERRLMDQQEQWITPNRVRVIWQ